MHGVQRSVAYEPGMAAIFLRPLPNESVELVIWGIDKLGLQTGARLVPMLTGVGQPDFLVIGDASRWKGIAGVIAGGFFDYQWNISSGSYV